MNTEGHLPPAARHILETIERDGPIRRQEILAKTDCPEGTFDDAITQLKRLDIVTTIPDPRDARQIRYDIQG